MTVSTGQGYRVRPLCSLHWACWNDEYVVFDEASGQTHQLDAIRAFVLQLLTEDIQTLSGILAALSEHLLVPNTIHLNEQLKTIFIEFETAGLVEAVAQ